MSEVSREYSRLDPNVVAQRKVDDELFGYLEAISQPSLLTREEEFALCEQMAAGREAQAQIDEGDEAEHLATRVALGRLARNQMIEANLRLAYTVAKEKSLPKLKMDLTDLANAGAEGLFDIVDKFDHTKGNKFSTYARVALKRKLAKVIAKEGRPFPLPEDIGDYLYRYYGARSKLESQQSGLAPTEEEYAKAANIPMNKMPLVRIAYSLCIISYDQPVGEEEEAMIGVIADTHPDRMSVEKVVLANEWQRTFDSLFSSLNKYEEEVVKRHFGIGYPAPMQYKEIGELLGKRRETISICGNKAIKKLQKHVEEHPDDAELLRDMLS
jgi:RNA polymerase primary sigma factor